MVKFHSSSFAVLINLLCFRIQYSNHDEHMSAIFTFNSTYNADKPPEETVYFEALNVRNCSSNERDVDKNYIHQY